MDRNQSTIEQQRLDQARLEANGMYSSQFERMRAAWALSLILKVKIPRYYRWWLAYLERLEHRGGAGADKDTGDGAGILVQIPHEFFKRECEVLGINLPAAGEYGVGMIFAHKYESLRNEQKRISKRLYAKRVKLFLVGAKCQLMVQRLVKKQLLFALGWFKSSSVKAQT